MFSENRFTIHTAEPNAPGIYDHSSPKIPDKAISLSLARKARDTAFKAKEGLVELHQPHPADCSVSPNQEIKQTKSKL